MSSTPDKDFLVTYEDHDYRVKDKGRCSFIECIDPRNKVFSSIRFKAGPTKEEVAAVLYVWYQAYNKGVVAGKKERSREFIRLLNLHEVLEPLEDDISSLKGSPRNYKSLF